MTGAISQMDGRGIVMNADGTAEIASQDLERCALRGPVITTDAGAAAALCELQAGDPAKMQALGLYILMFVPAYGKPVLRASFGAWCCRVGLSNDARAVEAATLAASLGIAPDTRAARPEADAAFEVAREERRRFERER